MEITPSLYISDLLQTEISKGVAVKIELDATTRGRLVRVAGLLEIDPGAFGCAIIERYVGEIFKYGKLEELEVDGGIFSSIQEQDRISLKAQAFDAERRAIRLRKGDL